MKKLVSPCTALFLLALAVLLVSCNEDDTDAKPKPVITLTSTTLSIGADATGTITASISASAGIAAVTATADDSTLGTVAVTNASDLVGEKVATATITFTSGTTLGTTTVTLAVTDDNAQATTATITVEVTDDTPIEIAGETGDSGTSEYYITDATTWGPDLTYHVTSNVFIESGASLTIESGTTVIVDGAYSFTVRGNFYSYGTEEDSVVFTVPAAQRTEDNIFEGLWGGILSSSSDGTNTYDADELVVLYTRIEYTGMLGQTWQDIVKLGEIDDTSTPEYALFFNNPDGVFILQNSTIAYSADVAVQVDQGHVLIANNAFVLNGESGGEAIDIKVGTYGDVAYNLFYKAATNGLKYNAKGGTSNLHVYNNTAVACGWRQTSHADHGGSFNVEQGGRGMLYNNLIVNCTRGVRFSDGKLADVAYLSDGYNYHYLSLTGPVGTDDYSPQFYPEDGFIIYGNGSTGPNEVDSTFETSHDFPTPIYDGDDYDAASTIANSEDPLFVNFTVSTFDDAAALAAEEPANEGFPDTYDFHLQSSSPALTAGYTGFSPYNSSGLSADGITYTSPDPSSYIGAYSTE